MSRSAQVHVRKANLANLVTKLTERQLPRIAMAEIRSYTQSYEHETVGVVLRVVIFISVRRSLLLQDQNIHNSVGIRALVPKARVPVNVALLFWPALHSHCPLVWAQTGIRV